MEQGSNVSYEGTARIERLRGLGSGSCRNISCRSKTARTGGSTNKVVADGGDGMRTLGADQATPRVRAGRPPGAKSDAGFKAVSEVIEGDAISRHGDLALIGGKG